MSEQSCGVYVTLFCTDATDDGIVAVVELLVDEGLDCVLVMDTELAREEFAMELAHRLIETPSNSAFMLIPSPFMGPPMFDLESVRKWISSIYPAIQPFSSSTVG